MKKSKIFLGLAIASILVLSSCNGNNDESSSDNKQTITSPDVTPQKIEISGKLKENYGLNSNVDSSDLFVLVTYSDNTTKRIPLYDSSVTIDAFDTSTIGNHTVTVSYMNLTTTLSYNVKQFKASLEFLDGSYEDKDSLELLADKNVISLKNITPEALNPDYHFAGWFYDEELTKRVSFDVDEDLELEDDITIYAGYDIDYSNRFSYTVNDDATATLNRLFVDPDEFYDYIYIPKTIDLWEVSKIDDDFLIDVDPFTLDFISMLEFEEGSNVKTIGKRAFSTCMFMYDAILPDSIEYIDEEAFQMCALENIILPKNLKTIGTRAFYGNLELEYVDFNDSDLISIGSYAFSDCSKLEEITLSDNIQIIGNSAFKGCIKFTEFNIPKSVEAIGVNVFSGLPNLERINVDPDNKKYKSIDGNLYSNDGSVFYRYCYGKDEEEFTLPDTVKTIFEGSFDKNTEIIKLKTLNIPDSVEEIADNAFENSTVDFVLPKSLKKISQKAFYGYKGSEFKISELNTTYKVVNSSIVSKDGKRLYAILDNYQGGTYVLDKDVEVIEAYSSKSLNVVSFIIPSDSKLKTIESNGLALYSCKNLKLFYIKKETPFEINKDSLEGESSISVDLSIVIDDNAYDNYLNKWSNLKLKNERIDINDILFNANNYLEYVVNNIPENLAVTGYDRYNQFNVLLDCIDFYDDFYRFNSLIQLISSVVNLDIPTEYQNYFINMFKRYIDKAIEYYKDMDGYMLNTDLRSFNVFFDVFINANQSLISAIDNDKVVLLNELYDKYSNYTALKNAVVEEIMEYDVNKESFNIENLKAIIAKIDEYRLGTSFISNDQYSKVNTIKYAYAIYQFTTEIEFTKENYQTLYTIYNGNGKDIPSIALLESYVPVNVVDTIYGYDILADKKEELDNLCLSIINDALELLKNQPLEFDDAHYNLVFESFSYLNGDFSQMDSSANLEYKKAILRLYMNRFISLFTDDIDDEALALMANYILYTDLNKLDPSASDDLNTYAKSLPEYEKYLECENEFDEMYTEVITKLDENLALCDSNDINTLATAINYYLAHYNFVNAVNSLISSNNYNYSYAGVIAAYLLDDVLENGKDEDYEVLFANVYGEGGINDYLKTYGKNQSFLAMFNKLVSSDKYNQYIALKKNL